MCYNDCEYFKFNPMTGADKCVRPNDGPCPDEIINLFCVECDEEYEMIIGDDICPVCGCDELIEI